MAGQILPLPHTVAIEVNEMFRANAQAHLDGFLARYREQLAEGDDPNLVFAILYKETIEEFNDPLGRMAVATVVCAAVERLARQ